MKDQSCAQYEGGTVWLYEGSELCTVGGTVWLYEGSELCTVGGTV